MTEQDRAEFEAWASGRYGLIQRDFLRGVDGYYCKMTRLAYASWLAARRTQNAKVRELVEAVEKINLNRDEPMSRMIGIRHAQRLAAQLKEQDDD